MEVPLTFFTAVWGKLYVEQFLNVVLPCALSPNNFGESKYHPEDRYYLFTGKDDEKTFRESRVFQKLNSLIKTDLIVFDLAEASTGSEAKAPYWAAWRRLTALYREYAPISARNGSAMVYVGGDEVFADGAFRSIRRIINSGKKVVLVAGIPVKPELFIEPLKSGYLNPAECVIDIKPRQMVKLAVDAVHEYISTMSWHNPLKQNGGGSYVFPVPGEGIITRPAGANPQAIVHREGDPPWPIDAGFERVDHVTSLYDWKDIYYIQDSDELILAGLEFTTADDDEWKLHADQMYQPSSILREAASMKERFHPSNTHLVRHTVRWHYNDFSPRWMAHEQYAESVIQSIFSCKEFFDRNPEAFADVKRQFAAIDSLRNERKRWLEFAAEHEADIPQLPPNLAAELYAGLSTLYATDKRYGKIGENATKFLFAEPNLGVQLVSDIVCLLKNMGRENAADDLVAFCKNAIDSVASQTIQPTTPK